MTAKMTTLLKRRGRDASERRRIIRAEPRKPLKKDPKIRPDEDAGSSFYEFLQTNFRLSAEDFKR